MKTGIYQYSRILIGLIAFCLPNIGVAQNIANPSLYKIESKSFKKIVQLDGKVMPYIMREVKMPLETSLVEMNYHYGDKVGANVLLMRLEAPELKDQIREAKIALLKLEEEVGNVIAWEQSNETIKLKDSQMHAKEQYTSLKTHYKKSKILWQKGIISKDELESERKALLQARRAYLHYRQSYEEYALNKEKSKRIMKLKLSKQQNQLKALQKQRNQLRVYSPFDAFILPPVKEQNNPYDVGILSPGKTFQAGEIIATFAQIHPFIVVVRADELDIVGLHKDSSATIHFHNHPQEVFLGKIIEIKPHISNERYSQPGFVVSILVDKPDIKTTWQFGMGAVVSFEKNVPSQGWVIPKSALYYDDATPFCKIQSDSGEKKALIKIGKTTIDSVEVVSGLEAGQYVHLND